MPMKVHTTDNLHHPALQKTSGFKYYHLLLAAYIMVLLTTSIMGLTFMKLELPFFPQYSLPLASSVFFFPMLFFIDDVVTEVYGYSAARHMMWIGMVVYLIFFGCVMLAAKLPIAPQWQTQGAEYRSVFSFLPRIALSFIVGLFVGSIVNDYTMAKVKIFLHGKFFVLRALGSSMIGELALQVAGTTVGLVGKFDYWHTIVPIIIVAYCYKVLFNIVSSVFSYPLQKALKKAEKIDYYDRETNFNPFCFELK